MKKKRNLLMMVLAIILLVNLNVVVFAASNSVATISGKSYKTLEKAIKSVKNGQTITVLENISTNSTVTINKKGVNFTINFAGNSYYYKGTGNAFNLKTGNITIKNGNIKSKNYIFHVQKNCNLTITNGKYTGYNCNLGNCYVKNGNFTTKGVPGSNTDELFQNYGKMEVRKGNFLGEDDNAILNSGTLLIKNGSFKSTAQSENGMYPVIMNNKKATCEIRGGTFNGKECSIWNSGNLLIYDGTFNATEYNTLVNQGTAKIEGGTFTIGNKRYCLICNWNNMTINDGTFTGCVINDTSSSGVLNINGGNYKCTFDCAIYNYRGKVNIKNGLFITRKHNTIFNDTKGILKVYGGTYKCTGDYYVLNNLGKAYLKGGRFYCKNSANSIYAMKGSVLQVNRNVIYSGDIDYE